MRLTNTNDPQRSTGHKCDLDPTDTAWIKINNRKCECMVVHGGAWGGVQHIQQRKGMGALTVLGLAYMVKWATCILHVGPYMCATYLHVPSSILPPAVPRCSSCRAGGSAGA